MLHRMEAIKNCSDVRGLFHALLTPNIFYWNIVMDIALSKIVIFESNCDVENCSKVKRLYWEIGWGSDLQTSKMQGELQNWGAFIKIKIKIKLFTFVWMCFLQIFSFNGNMNFSVNFNSNEYPHCVFCSKLVAIITEIIVVKYLTDQLPIIKSFHLILMLLLIVEFNVCLDSCSKTEDQPEGILIWYR